MDLDTIIKQIQHKRPEITKQQILTRLSATRDMTGGLIADESLIRVIAAELGVEMPRENGTFNHKLSLGHVVAGLNNATVMGRVLAIYPAKTFEGIKSGKFSSVIIADKDGTLRVVLWNEKADQVEAIKLKVGEIVRFAHGYTKADRFGTPEMHVGEKSTIEQVVGFNIADEDYPQSDKLATKVKDLEPHNRNVILQGTVTDVYQASVFKRSDETPGKVLRFKISDGTGTATVVAWNEKAEELESDLKRNSQVELVNAKVKTDQNGELEVHADASTYIRISEKRKPWRIADLTENLFDLAVEGEVASLPLTREVKTAKGETVKLTVFDLQDGSGTIRVTAWRTHSETASSLQFGEKILLDSVYVKKAYDGKLELSTGMESKIIRDK